MFDRFVDHIALYFALFVNGLCQAKDAATEETFLYNKKISASK